MLVLLGYSFILLIDKVLIDSADAQAQNVSCTVSSQGGKDDLDEMLLSESGDEPQQSGRPINHSFFSQSFMVEHEPSGNFLSPDKRMRSSSVGPRDL